MLAEDPDLYLDIQRLNGATGECDLNELADADETVTQEPDHTDDGEQHDDVLGAGDGRGGERVGVFDVDPSGLSEIAGVILEREARIPTVALVGYTNAGKSSLMRAMTGSEVLVADKLFATLDTTVRALHPESVPRVLVSDTVGFIKNLPHGLVASFKSTLDEALEARQIAVAERAVTIVAPAPPGLDRALRGCRPCMKSVKQ